MEGVSSKEVQYFGRVLNWNPVNTAAFLMQLKHLKLEDRSVLAV